MTYDYGREDDTTLRMTYMIYTARVMYWDCSLSFAISISISSSSLPRDNNGTSDVYSVIVCTTALYNHTSAHDLK